MRVCVLLFSILVGSYSAAASATTAKHPDALVITVNGKSASQMVLTQGGFLDPFGYTATLGVNHAFAPGSVHWTVSSPSIVTLATTDPRNFSGSPTPLPNSISAFMTRTLGMAIVTATVGRLKASIPVYTYSNVFLRCQFRYTPAYSFDPGASPNGLSSDLYVTEAADTKDPLNPCTGSVFITGTTAIHVPYGGVIIPNAKAFPSIKASQWTNALTQTDESALRGNVLLFKTKGGAIVKAVLWGPVEVTDASGAFPY